jgi:hypothetical protein
MDAATRSPIRDISKVIDRLPQFDEYRRVKHLILKRTEEPYATDDELARVLPFCSELESVVLCGVKGLACILSLSQPKTDFGNDRSDTTDRWELEPVKLGVPGLT